jgi:hypothetical protein
MSKWILVIGLPARRRRGAKWSEDSPLCHSERSEESLLNNKEKN